MKMAIRMIAASLLLTACADLPPYQQPLGGEPTATLVVRNSVATSVNFFPSTDAANCKGARKAANLMNLTQGAETEIKVQAGKDFSMQALTLSKNGEVCDTHSTFRPEANSRYVATYTEEDSHCGIAIEREVLVAGKPVLQREPTYRSRKTIVPFSSIAYCEPEVQ